jgi:hypothetical protein
MKNQIFSLVVFLSSFIIKAAPGDTLWVTAFQDRKLTYTGAYDTSVTFPANLSSNKVLMYLTLGVYACPGNPQYCADWDYTCDIILRPQGNDTVQIGKYITPYSGNWGASTKHEYILDVTDYAKLMNGLNGLRFIYDGYSYGFKITMKFAFIEGTPYQDVIDIKRIYPRKYYYFGNTPGQIENELSNKTVSTGSNVSRSVIKNFISGHGADANTYCAEFCSMTYSLLINNTFNASKDIWRDNCGYNHVYPQTGTWVYDRANWCPGDVSYPILHNVSSIIGSNSSYSVNIDMPPYANASGQACYALETQLITYKAPNFTNDVGLEWIYNPTNDDDAIRDNPTCSNPRVLIKNYGSANLTSAVFNYSINSIAVGTFSWSGNLSFLDTISVNLPCSSTLFPAPSTSNNVFVVTVNTSGDENPFNNRLQSKFARSAEYAITKLVVTLITNNSTGSNNFNETKWYLYNEGGNLVGSRTNAANSTMYNDTVLVSNGCYKLVVNDEGCDGVSWWANQAAGNGSVRLKNGNTGNALKYYNGDFGCQFIDHFTVNTSFTGLVEITKRNFVEIYPNPVQNNFKLELNFEEHKDVQWRIISPDGKLVKSGFVNHVKENYLDIQSEELSEGIYMMEVMAGDLKFTKKLVKQNP